MTVWKFLGIVAAGIGLLAAGLAIAYRWELEWLRVAVTPVVTVAVAVAVMVVKRRGQRRDRSMAADSVERAFDERARSGAFVDVLLATAVMVLLGALYPQMPVWLLGVLLLAAAVVDYWIRRVLVERRDGARSE